MARSRVRAVVAFLVAALLGVALPLAAPDPAAAAVARPFTPRFSTTARGDIIATGNTVVTCTAPLLLAPSCPGSQAGTTGNNDQFVNGYVDVDSVAATVNSSRANVAIPAGATVLFAGLYWAGTGLLNNAARGSVQFAPPGQGYTTVNGTVTAGSIALVEGFAYGAVADVTSLVRASGTYTVGGVSTSTLLGLGNARGGWALVVVVRDQTQPLRHLTVLDGFAEIGPAAGDRTASATISGFRTPPTGAFGARVGVVAAEGDANDTGDAFRVNTTDVSDGLNPANNVFNSSFTRTGSRVTLKEPDHANQLGFDVDTIALPAGAIPNDATSATLAFTTSMAGDSYEALAMFAAIDVFRPHLDVAKTATPVGTANARPGGEVDYAVTVASGGSEPAGGVVLLDPIPADTTYVAGTLTVDGVAVTDAAGDDRGELDTTTNRVAVRLGSGATPSAGGTLAAGTSSVVRFRVRVSSAAAAGTVVSNSALVNYASPSVATAYSAGSNAAALTLEAVPVTGGLGISAPDDRVLGSGTVGATSLAGTLGTVTVTDTRTPLARNSWTASVTSTDFVTGTGTNSAQRVTAGSVAYSSGAATSVAGQGTFTPASGQGLGSPRTAASWTGGLGAGGATVSWNPTLTLTLSTSQVSGTYTGTVVHSVA